MKFNLPQKNGAFLSFTPLLNVNVFFCKFCFNLTWFGTKLKVLVLCIFYFMKKNYIFVFWCFDKAPKFKMSKVIWSN